MVGKSHRLSLNERFVRIIKANTNRSAGGLATNSAPSLLRDRIAASARTTTGLSTTAIKFKIDEFTVTDDGTDTFTLTHTPLADSWRVWMGWPWAEARYTIAGRTLTVTDPTDTFREIAANGDRTLHVGYAYLIGVATSPAPGGTLVETATANSSAVAVDVPSGTQVGDILVAWLVAGFDVNVAPSGWTLLDSQGASSGGNTTYTHVYWKVADAGDIGGQFTATNTGGYWWTGAIVTCQGYSSIGAHSAAGATGSSVGTPAEAAVAGTLILRAGLIRSSGGTTDLSIDSGTEILAPVGNFTSAVVTSELSTGSAAAGTVTATGADATAGIVGSTVVVVP